MMLPINSYEQNRINIWMLEFRSTPSADDTGVRIPQFPFDYPGRITVYLRNISLSNRAIPLLPKR